MTLVCVTKGVPPDVIQQALALGVIDVGENRVQEAHAKQQAAGFKLQASGISMQPVAWGLQRVRWHLVGHLQRNKVKDAVELFDVIHSLDSERLAEELERQAAKRRVQGSRFQVQGPALLPLNLQPLEVFIQVNISGETTKFGCSSEETSALARTVMHLPHLRLKGLMTLAPFAEDPEQARPHFRRLRQLRDEVAVACSLQPVACSLSMGMSQDFEVAIEEGADVVRIGTAIFGPRTVNREP